MPIPLLIPLIAAGASAIGTGISAWQSRKNTKDTIEAQKQAAALAHNRDLEMWQMTNEYNMPSEQMARLKQAGLNPAMIYGSGGAKTTAATMPKYQAVRPDYSGRTPIADPTAVIGAYQNFRVQNQQIDNLRQQGKVLQAESEIKNQEARGAPMYFHNRAKYQNYIAATRESEYFAKKPHYGELAKSQLQFAQLGVNKRQNEMQKMDAEIAYKKKQIEWYDAKTMSSIGSQLLNSLTGGFGRTISGFKGIKSPPKTPKRKSSYIRDRDWSQFKNY